MCTNTFGKWPQILKLFCFLSCRDAKLSTFECTLRKSFVRKPQRAMNMFIHGCFKNTDNLAKGALSMYSQVKIIPIFTILSS